MCVCVLALYLPQSSLVSTLLSEQCRGAAEGGNEGGLERGRREKWRSAGSETEERLFACTVALWVWQAAVEQGSTREVRTDPLSLFMARLSVLAEKKSFPCIKEIPAAWLIKVGERGRRKKEEKRRGRRKAMKVEGAGQRRGSE